jgi:hypothetical protein
MAEQRWTLYVNPQGSVVHTWQSGAEVVDVMPVSEHERIVDSINTRLALLGDTIGDLARLQAAAQVACDAEFTTERLTAMERLRRTLSRISSDG